MKLLHHYAAWILFVYKMVRINLQVGVAPIYTLLKPPIEQDYKKLGRGISYLNENIYLPLLIVANNNGTLTLYIDTSFPVRLDCTSHTGVCLILVKESVLSISAKQKISNKCLI